MAECFCGCGQKVGLTSRGFNKQGRRTVGLLAKLREARAVVVEQQPSPEQKDERVQERALEMLDELIANGEEYEQFWADAVHGYLPPMGEAKQIKREWESWGGLGMKACDAAGVQIDRSVRATARGNV
jgi:hypothetical protein